MQELNYNRDKFELLTGWWAGQSLGHFDHVDNDGLDAIAFALNLGQDARHFVPVEWIRVAAVDVDTHLGRWCVQLSGSVATGAQPVLPGDVGWERDFELARELRVVLLCFKFRMMCTRRR